MENEEEGGNCEDIEAEIDIKNGKERDIGEAGLRLLTLRGKLNQ
jgi:hypothetical protein